MDLLACLAGVRAVALGIVDAVAEAVAWFVVHVRVGRTRGGKPKTTSRTYFSSRAVGAATIR